MTNGVIEQPDQDPTSKRPMNQLAELPRNELQQNQQNGQMGSLAESNLDHQEGVDVWGIIARRKWLVILGVILGLGLGYIYLLQAAPVYESIAQVLIEERKPPTLPIAGLESSLGFASAEAKHAHMLRSPAILDMAYSDFGISRLASMKDQTTAMRMLSGNLNVSLVEEGTHILNVRYRGPSPDDTQAVITSLLNAYQRFLEDTYESEGKDTRTLISEARDDLWTNLEEYNKQYREFKISSPLLWRGDEAINMHQDRQVKYEEERVKLTKDLADIRSRSSVVAAAISDDGNLEAVLLQASRGGYRFDQSSGGGGYREAARVDRYLALLLEEDALTIRYGDDHPDVVSVRSRIAKFREMYPQVTEGTTAVHSEEEAQQYAERYLVSLNQQASALEAHIQRLDGLFKEEEAAAKQLQDVKAQEEFLRGQISRTEQLFNVVVGSLEEVSLVEDYQGYTYRKLAEPGIGEKVAPMPLKVMPIAAILGASMGFGLAYLVDVADKAFRTPDEVGQIMRVPVVGHIPLIDVANQKTLPGSKVQPVICTVHRPKSPQAESYRAVRTALYFNNREMNNQVIQMTSPMPGDGKSTLGANLAVTIAQSGKRVLLLDADFRRPTLHKVFGLGKANVGLASVVNGDTEPNDAMQYLDEVPNLSLMACGPRPSNPSELLSSEQFADVLGMLREQFDFVLVDTPPVLAVSDPCAVAARVDGVLLTFRIHKRARPLAVRARDALLGIGANVIGVVVNGVDQEAGGYYSQYRYGYTGYRYAYNQRQYGYGYGYGTYGSEKTETKAIKKYFDDEGTGAIEPASAPVAKD